MNEPLFARLNSRVVVVTGKGGVGKTTTSGALALAFADRGLHVHLISTDPAHSLADLFGSISPDCSTRLVLEEFNARAYADALFSRIQPSLAALIERGTYLDEGDAHSFLDLSVPGIDEVMAALRLVDLLAMPELKIVVDTAPTGHTLRLLESPRVLRSWVAAGRAMAEKAAAVAEQLLRQTVRFPAEDVLDELDNAANAFERGILQNGSFVVVTKHAKVIEAETTRLTAALEAGGVHVAVRISDAPSPGPGDSYVAPRLQNAVGCAALRKWIDRIDQQASPKRHLAETHDGNAEGRIAATATRLLWTAGKGGVGKSTCAAALATLLAETRNVCLVSTDPAGSLSEVLEIPITLEGVRVSSKLFARQIDASAEFVRMREEYRHSVEDVFEKLGLETAAQLDRRVVEALFDFAPPGIDEIVALIEILEHAGDYDVTIIDSAPTGHFLRLLEMPEIAMEWMHALMRLLVKYHAVASLDSLGHNLLAFSKRLRQLKLDLSDVATTQVYVVTQPEPMILAETRRLCAALANANVPVAAVIVNRADAHEPLAARSNFSAHHVIYAPDAGGEIMGTAALRGFLAQWEYADE